MRLAMPALARPGMQRELMLLAAVARSREIGDARLAQCHIGKRRAGRRLVVDLRAAEQRGQRAVGSQRIVDRGAQRRGGSGHDDLRSNLRVLRRRSRGSGASRRLAHRDDAVDARAVAEAMPRRDAVAHPDRDAMGDRRTRRIRDHRVARRHRLELRPQRRHRRVCARDAARAVRGLDRLLKREPAVEFARRRHSASTR